MIDYIIQQDPWFSPKTVILNFNKLIKVFSESTVTKEKVFERAVEMFIGAVTLLGLYKMNPINIYHMQSNNQTKTPDLVAAKYNAKNVKNGDLPIIQVEHVVMGQFAGTDNALEFLIKTKLSPKKSYGKDDLIILEVNRKVQLNPVNMYKKLQQLKPKPHIYILGYTKITKEFLLYSVYPQLSKIVQFKINEVITSYEVPDKVDYTRTGNTVTKQINTYNVLGLDQNKIFKKLGIKMS